MQRRKVWRTLRPGDMGAKTWQQLYGKSLVAVRWYKGDKGERITTVELQVETKQTFKVDPNKTYPISIGWGEQGLRDELMRHGANWDEKNDTWWLAQKHIVKLGLANRIDKALFRRVCAEHNKNDD